MGSSASRRRPQADGGAGPRRRGRRRPLPRRPPGHGQLDGLGIRQRPGDAGAADGTGCSGDRRRHRRTAPHRALRCGRHGLALRGTAPSSSPRTSTSPPPAARNSRHPPRRPTIRRSGPSTSPITAASSPRPPGQGQLVLRGDRDPPRRSQNAGRHHRAHHRRTAYIGAGMVILHDGRVILKQFEFRHCISARGSGPLRSGSGTERSATTAPGVYLNYPEADLTG